jgi:heptaprenyl diphosphate synthase
VTVTESGESRGEEAKLLAFMAAMCFFLSACEYAVPKPVPILRLGLANAPVILGLSKLRTRSYFLLVFLKVATAAFVSGTIFSYIFAFSAAGSFASALAMRLLYRLFVWKKARPLLGCAGLSAAGSLANNAAQLVLARFFIFREGARYIAPLLLISGFVTGIALGLFTQVFTERSRWYKALPDGDSPSPRKRAGPGLLDEAGNPCL